MTEVVARRIGAERQPVVVVDGFHPDPDALRAAATASAFAVARHHYPGLRGELPPSYFAEVRGVLAPILRDVFGADGGVDLIDASFSIVTTPPAALSVAQRLPHVDAVEPGRIAFVHYLAPQGSDGTAFFRHRTTGFETIDRTRSAIYLPMLDAELRDHPPPPAYLAGSTPLFEQVAAVDARYNRAVIYRSALLHCGAISADAALDPDPATGRLTVTGFLSVR